MFQPNCLKSPATVPVFSNQSPCVEGEFAFRFSRSLPPRPEGYKLEEVLEAVESVLPAIEVVGCRFEGGYDGLGALRLVADATAHTAFVSGSPSAEWRSMDLNSHRATMFRNGAEISEGTGANVLDGPSLRPALDRQSPIAPWRHHRSGGGSYHRDLHRHNARKPRRRRYCRLRQPG